MSRKNNWVPLDKNLAQTLSGTNRPYSKVEAMFSHTIDIDCDRRWTINGYAKLWQWSRTKVRKFLSEIKTHCGHFKDTTRTDYKHPIHFIDKGLWEIKNTLKTHSKHIKDTLQDTTNNPNPNPNPNPKEKDKDKGKKKCATDAFRPSWISVDLWKELIANRKMKKLSESKLALTTFTNSLEKGVAAGYSIDVCVGEYVASSWKRFDHSWINKKDNNDGNKKNEHQQNIGTAAGYSDAENRDWTA